MNLILHLNNVIERHDPVTPTKEEFLFSLTPEESDALDSIFVALEQVNIPYLRITGYDDKGVIHMELYKIPSNTLPFVLGVMKAKLKILCKLRTTQKRPVLGEIIT